MATCYCSLAGSRACEACTNGSAYHPLWLSLPETTAVYPIPPIPKKPVRRVVHTYEYDANGHVIRETSEESEE